MLDWINEFLTFLKLVLFRSFGRSEILDFDPVFTVIIGPSGVGKR